MPQRIRYLIDIQGAGSRVGCGLSLFSGFLPVCPVQTPCPGVTRTPGTEDLARVPRIQTCCPTGAPTCRRQRPLATAITVLAVAGLDPDQASGPGTGGGGGAAAAEHPSPVNPCGNFSGTSSLKFRGTKGSIGHTFMVCIHTENQNQGDFYPFVLLEISVLHESPLGHLRCCLTDVPPQPNSPPDNVFNPDRPAKDLNARRWAVKPSSASLNK